MPEKDLKELIEVKERIEQIISAIGKFRREIEQRGKEKAKAISDYDRKLAVTLATLKNADNYQLGGKTYPVPPITLMEKIAKGICADERYQLEIAESGYKACISNLEALMAQLNAYQSIYRHLDIT